MPFRVRQESLRGSWNTEAAQNVTLTAWHAAPTVPGRGRPSPQSICPTPHTPLPPGLSPRHTAFLHLHGTPLPQVSADPEQQPALQGGSAVSGCSLLSEGRRKGEQTHNVKWQGTQEAEVKHEGWGVQGKRVTQDTVTFRALRRRV